MKRKSAMAASALLLSTLLCACTPQQVNIPETTTQTTEASETMTETTQPAAIQQESGWQDTPAHNAFRKTLKTIHDELYLPLPNASYKQEIDLFEPGTIEDENFAVLDVDADGEDELIVTISNTYTAGTCTVVYDYDADTDDVREEACTGLAAKFYPGMIRVEASHNHGHAGDVLWPYAILTYDQEKDVYTDTFYVDAWSKEIADYDSSLDMAYPEEIDTEHDGFVYLITENGQQRVINRKDYESWEADMFSQKEPLTVSWQKITSENI